MGFPRTQRSRREGPSRLISRQTSYITTPHHTVRVFCNSREQMASPVHPKPCGRDQAPSLGLPPDPRACRQTPRQRDTALCLSSPQRQTAQLPREANTTRLTPGSLLARRPLPQHPRPPRPPNDLSTSSGATGSGEGGLGVYARRKRHGPTTAGPGDPASLTRTAVKGCVQLLSFRT